jgi:phage baseplate assembly protein W
MATKPKISRGFKDFSISFKKHPITNDLIVLSNENAIKNSIVNLVRTRLNERFYQPLLGTAIEDSLFELSTSEITFKLENEVNQVIRNFEPRVFVTNIDIKIQDDVSELDISIVYDIIGLEPSRQSVNVILRPTRI